MVLRPRYGTVGMAALPVFWSIELLGPVIELTGYGMLAALLLLGGPTTAALLVFAMACLHGLTQSLTALVTEGAGLPLPRRPAAAGGGLPAGAAALPPAAGLLALPGAGDHGAAGPVGLRCPQAPFLTGAEKARRPVV